MGRLVEEGVSRKLRVLRNTLATDNNGYVFPIKLYTNYFF